MCNFEQSGRRFEQCFHEFEQRDFDLQEFPHWVFLGGLLKLTLFRGIQRAGGYLTIFTESITGTGRLEGFGY